MRREASTRGGGPAGPVSAVPGDAPSGAVRQGIPPGAVRGGAPSGGAGAPWRLLEVMRWLRARERGAVTGLIHDGPMQELATVALELAVIRRRGLAASDDGLDRLEHRLDAVGRSLRCLLGELWPFPQDESTLAAALVRRTAWLLAEPIAVDASEGTSALSEGEISAIADVTELLLLGTVRAGAPVRVLAAVRADESRILLEMSFAATGGRTPAGDAAAAGVWLDRLAAMLGARAAATEVRGRRLLARLELRRPAAHG
jgi:hypothetical protein